MEVWEEGRNEEKEVWEEGREEEMILMYVTLNNRLFTNNFKKNQPIS